MKTTNFLELSKKECIEGGKQTALNDIEEAQTNLLDAYMYTKAQIDYLTAYTEAIHEEAMEEYEQYGEKEVEKHGRRISKFEVGVKYDFSKCGHPDIEKFESSMKRDKAHLDATKKMVRGLQKPMTIFDEDTGETFKVRPPIKTSTTKLKIVY